MAEARTWSDGNGISTSKIKALSCSTEVNFVKVWKFIL
jgi:hypothetical protein